MLNKVKVEELKKFYSANDRVITLKPIIALVMRLSGASYREIGEVLGVTRQNAEVYTKRLEKLYVE